MTITDRPVEAVDTVEAVQPVETVETGTGVAATIRNHPEVLRDGRVVRSAVVGAALGIVAFVVGVGALGLWVGLDLGAALALGAFTGFWGGLGFGGMIGGVVGVNRTEVGNSSDR